MIKKLLNKLPSVRTTGIVVILCLGITTTYHFLFGETVRPKTVAEFSKTSVMITGYDGRSGGTGVIISSKRNESKILTNKHVCQVAKQGGIVRTDDKAAMVKHYQESNIHDLCLITVNTNFKINTVIAKSPPEVYDKAIVSGHPRLLRNIVTYGHFSGHEMISVMTGLRKCSIEELDDPSISFICMLLGGIPIVKRYEAQVISNTIQPGSSGSAVFNENGEIAGLVFAGSGEFGYGHIVSHEYIVSFFEIEVPQLVEVIPSQPVFSDQEESKVDWKRICMKNLNNDKVQEICALAAKSLLLNNN